MKCSHRFRFATSSANNVGSSKSHLNDARLKRAEHEKPLFVRSPSPVISYSNRGKTKFSLSCLVFYFKSGFIWCIYCILNNYAMPGFFTPLKVCLSQCSFRCCKVQHRIPKLHRRSLQTMINMVPDLHKLAVERLLASLYIGTASSRLGFHNVQANSNMSWISKPLQTRVTCPGSWKYGNI